MLKERDFKKLKITFYNYIENLNVLDNDEISEEIKDKFKSKIDHTEEVIKLGEILANKLNLNVPLTKTICLLHDIGRFRQIKKYNTFIDSESEDHAELGLKVIKENKLLENIDEKQIIIDSIKYHNKISYKVPELKEPTNTYVKLIRDADKVDIFRIVIQKKYYINLDKEYNKKCYEDFINEKEVDINDVKTNLDKLIMDLSWIYGINYEETFDLLKKQKFLRKLAKLLPEEFEEIKNKVDKFIR